MDRIPLLSMKTTAKNVIWNMKIGSRKKMIAMQFINCSMDALKKNLYQSQDQKHLQNQKMII